MLSSSDRGSLLELLVLERQRARIRIAALTREFDAIVSASADAANDDEHDPEGSTIGFERAQVTALLNQARGQAAEVERSLARLESGGYGACERCGGAIPFARLEAFPTARKCVDCAS